MTQSRSAERFRLARLAVAFGSLESLIVGAALATRLALLVWGLGRRDYGLYMAVLGLVATANSLDFGLHYGVTNLVSAARGRDDEASVRRTIATAFMTYAAVSLAAFCVVLILVARAPIGWLLSIEPAEVHVARLVAVLGFASMLLPMPLKVFGAGMVGYQEQHAVSVYRSLNSLIQLGMLSLTIVAFRGKLPAIASVACVTDLSLWSLFALWIVRHRPLLALHLPSASRMQVLPLLVTGLTFFITSMTILLKGAIGNTIIAHGLGPEGVGPFSVPLALFSTANTLAALSAVSLWPAFGEAAARGDWTWVGKAFVLGAKACL